MGWNSAHQFHNVESSKPVTKPGQPYPTDTVNTQAGNDVNILYTWEIKILPMGNFSIFEKNHIMQGAIFPALLKSAAVPILL